MTTARLNDAVLTIADQAGGVLGTCFLVPVLDSRRTGTYLLTAAHCLRLEARRGGQVVVTDRAAHRHHAEVLVCPPPGAPDIGLLYVDQPLGPPVVCADSPLPDEVVVRGALSGLDTDAGTVRGRFSGLESLDGEQMMAVVIQDLGVLERPESAQHVRSLAFAGLRGMSGAPVCHTDPDRALVCGMVVRRNVSGLANRVYALPLDTIRRFLDGHGFVLRVHQQLDSSSPANLLTGRLITRLLGSPGGLHQLWDDASALFYSGVPVDQAFVAAIRQPESFGLEGLQVAEVRFLLARLLFKRGDERAGLAALQHARTLARRSSANEYRHLAALIDLRMMLYSARELSPVQRRSFFERSVGAYEQVPGRPRTSGHTKSPPRSAARPVFSLVIPRSAMETSRRYASSRPWSRSTPVS